MGKQKLKSLHEVITLQKVIYKLRGMEICEVCAFTRMRNRINAILAERKSQILDLVSIDICGALPTSLDGSRYFLEIVDNHTRKT
jgi:hypothetical protein